MRQSEWIRITKAFNRIRQHPETDRTTWGKCLIAVEATLELSESFDVKEFRRIAKGDESRQD